MTTVVTEVGVELPFQIKLKGITVRGKIDRLEQDDQGNYYVIDYKTGACFETVNTISELSLIHI